MERIILRRITMQNFKGETQRTSTFSDDITTISGGNGLGKSRHYEAFLWCLFGKDSQDRKDYEIRTRVNGEVVHKVECSVEVELIVDGEVLTLKRELAEEWVKPRGQIEEVFKGNKTLCWFNGVPLSVSEYNERVNMTIIDDTIARMLMNTTFFANMKWNLQREALCQLAGEVSDEDIAGDNPQFRSLLASISGKPWSDFKKELAARKKRLKSEKDEILPRIEQTKKMMPEAEDFDHVREHLSKVDAELADIDAAMTSVSEAARQTTEQVAAIQRQIQEHVTAQNSETEEYNRRENQRVSDANRHLNELKNRYSDLSNEHTRLNRELDELEADIKSKSMLIQSKQDKLTEIRQQWYSVNGEEWKGDTRCPTCGQILPDLMIEEAKSKFDESKTKRLSTITQQGQELGKVIEGYKNDVASETTTQKDLEDKLRDNLEAIGKVKTELGNTKETAFVPFDAEHNVSWQEHQRQIDLLKKQIDTVSTMPEDNSQLVGKKKFMQTERDNLIARLQKESDIKRAEEEITNLQNREQELAQQIADAEREEYIAAQFTHKKITAVEERVNKMFKFVRFKMFDYTLDGNTIETCIPMCDGVPYPAANYASKVNAGLDIINTLQQHYEIAAPVFIDNRESVNDIIKPDTQIINLVVTADNTLTIQ